MLAHAYALVASVLHSRWLWQTPWGTVRNVLTHALFFHFGEIRRLAASSFFVPLVHEYRYPFVHVSFHVSLFPWLDNGAALLRS